MNKTVSIHTLGCRVNFYESCAIAEQLEKLGFTVSKNKESDYHIVNTCAVTSQSERKSRQLIRRCAADGKVLVIGCASQLGQNYSDIENVIYTGGNKNKSAVIDCILKDVNGEEYASNCVESLVDAPFEDMCISGKADIFSECRAFIKIQDGCNGKCTYCIIPKCRGSVRCREVDSIIAEAKRLVANGYKEIILTGIEISAYNKIPLRELIKQISEIEGVERLRLGSLSPNVINEVFLSTVSKLPNFMPHIHLSLQSCSDFILQDMRRPYRKDKIYEVVELIRKYIPDCQISADIIVGFPNEVAADFAETVNSIIELGIFHVHSFPYSERKGTPAATMPYPIPWEDRAERNLILISECKAVRRGILDRKMNTIFEVLIEQIEDGFAKGHTREFFEAKFEDNGYSVGDIVKIRAISHEWDVIFGKPL